MIGFIIVPASGEVKVNGGHTLMPGGGNVSRGKQKETAGAVSLGRHQASLAAFSRSRRRLRKYSTRSQLTMMRLST